MMLQCTPIVGTEVKFYLGIDVSMGCTDQFTTTSPVGGAALVLLVVTVLIPVYGAESLTVVRLLPESTCPVPFLFL